MIEVERLEFDGVFREIVVDEGCDKTFADASFVLGKHDQFLGDGCFILIRHGFFVVTGCRGRCVVLVYRVRSSAVVDPPWRQREPQVAIVPP
jgi:hypothetical protein